MKAKYIHSAPYRDDKFKLVPGEVYDLPEHVIKSIKERFEIVSSKIKTEPEVNNGD